MTKRSRITAAVLAITLLSVLLFSASFLVMQAEHDCPGEDCPICYQISVCENTLNTVGRAVSMVLFTAFIGILLLSLPASARKRVYRASLVSLKVKLSD